MSLLSATRTIRPGRSGRGSFCALWGHRLLSAISTSTQPNLARRLDAAAERPAWSRFSSTATPSFGTRWRSRNIYEDYPQVWPPDRRDRARARSLSAEVHSGMNALREAMPVNARGRNRIAKRSAAVAADIERVESIWAGAGQRANGPWLFGEFCAADIMFAPVALRFQTYAVELIGQSKLYYEALLSHQLT
jgi:hypothetical protein